MSRLKVSVIFGTRPEVIKLAPIIRILKGDPNFSVKVVNTAQHREMVDQLLSIFEIRPDVDLNIMRSSQSLSYITTAAINRLSELINDLNPNYVFVQGDTTTAMAAALVAFYHKIPLGHVEAGLRTYDRYSPFPEEMNRRIIGVLAYHHFAPTEKAVQALLAEGIEKDRIFLTGNTIVDALLQLLDSPQVNQIHFDFLDPAKKLILLTAHRRENWGYKLENICRAVKRIALEFDVEIVYPVHLNPNVRKTVFRTLKNVPNVHLINPVNYLELIALLKRSYFVMTDSGGIQEEAPVVGKPVLVLRDKTERPEGIELGVAKLVGTDENEIYHAAAELLENYYLYRQMATPKSPYGDGKAAQRIVRIVNDFFNS